MPDGERRRSDRVRPGHRDWRRLGHLSGEARDTRWRDDRVLAAIRENADADGRCRLGGAQLGKLTGLSAKAARSAVLFLARQGALVKAGGGDAPLLILATETTTGSAASRPLINDGDEDGEAAEA